jgi:hypothetical protein
MGEIVLRERYPFRNLSKNKSMNNQSLFILLLLCLGLSFYSCDVESIKASGDVTVETYNYTDFDGIDICCDMKAYITFSNSEEFIEIEADDNLHEHIVVELSGTTLVVRVKDNTRIRGNETMNVYITASSLTYFEASGDAEIYLENELTGEKVDIEVTGDSKFTGALEVESMDAELKGDSEMRITGSTLKLDAELIGDSKLENFDFVVEDLEIELAGDSEAYLTVTNSIDVEATGDSRLVYKGDAMVTRQRLTGDSELIKID